MKNEVVLVIRAKGKNHKLLLSAHPSYARIQLSTITYSNPETPPNFVMMLRKISRRCHFRNDSTNRKMIA